MDWPPSLVHRCRFYLPDPVWVRLSSGGSGVIFAPDNTPGLTPSPGRCRLCSELLVPSTPCGGPSLPDGDQLRCRVIELVEITTDQLRSRVIELVEIPTDRRFIPISAAWRIRHPGVRTYERAKLSN